VGKRAFRWALVVVVATFLLAAAIGVWAAREVLRYMSARCHVEKGRGDLAIRELLAIVEAPMLNADAAPCYPAAYYELGRAYEATGDVRRAIDAYETLLGMWKHADADLPLRVQAEERLRAMKRSM